MRVYLPWGIILTFISFYIFREYNRVSKAKRNERREAINERRQELLNNVLKKNKASKTVLDSHDAQPRET
ncbi:MAG TPA: hypothetical protein VK622_14025 [Puia sp.]|nr:hypothetical protein [Puia sp.]